MPSNEGNEAGTLAFLARYPQGYGVQGSLGRRGGAGLDHVSNLVDRSQSFMQIRRVDQLREEVHIWMLKTFCHSNP